MFLFYVLSLFKKRDTIQGGTSKGGHYLRKYGMCFANLVFWQHERFLFNLSSSIHLSHMSVPAPIDWQAQAINLRLLRCYM